MKRTLIAAALAALPLPVPADVTAKDAWVRGTTPAQKATGAFMELVSSEDATVVRAMSPVAGIVEIHTMKMEDGLMKMRPLPRLDLPIGKMVKLAPGGHHIMLMELKQQMKSGETVPITLKVEGKDKSVKSLEVTASVRDLVQPATMINAYSIKH